MTRERDPLLERLRGLPTPTLDEVAAARTLARAEAELTSLMGDSRRGSSGFAQEGPTPTPDADAKRAPLGRWRLLVPAALAAWGAFYLWAAIGEFGRLYPNRAAHLAAVTHGSAVARAAALAPPARERRDVRYHRGI